MLSKYKTLNNLVDSLEDLETLHDNNVWEKDEVTVLRAMVKIQEVVRDMEHRLQDDDYGDLSNQLGDTLAELVTAETELRRADNRIEELETEVGLFRVKAHTIEEVEDPAPAPDMFSVGDRVNDAFDGPGTVTYIDHENRSCDVVFDNDWTGYEPSVVAFKNLEILTEDTAELTDEPEDENPREPMKSRITDWGREVIEDFNGRNLKFQMDDLVKDSLTGRTGKITGYMEEGNDRRYELTCDDSVFGEWQVYAREYHLSLIEKHVYDYSKEPAQCEIDDEVFALDDDLPKPVFD